MKKKLQDDTMNESKLQRVYIYPINPRDSAIHSDKEFVSLDKGSQNGTHWTCFIPKITNPITLMFLVVNLINLYLINYLNQ